MVTSERFTLRGTLTISQDSFHSSYCTPPNNLQHSISELTSSRNIQFTTLMTIHMILMISYDTFLCSHDFSRRSAACRSAARWLLSTWWRMDLRARCRLSSAVAQLGRWIPWWCHLRGRQKGNVTEYSLKWNGIIIIDIDMIRRAERFLLLNFSFCFTFWSSCWAIVKLWQKLKALRVAGHELGCIPGHAL